MDITFQPIGFIHTPFTRRDEMPIQPTGDAASNGTIELNPEYAEGLLDLEGFSHLVLIYHLHKANKVSLVVTPFLDSSPHGVFATRAPARPNPIGLSVVRLIGIEGSTLHISDVDVLDGTPLLDIKPFVPAFDSPDEVQIGWLKDVDQEVRSVRSDDRFG